MKNVVYATRGVTTVVSATDGFTDLPHRYLTPSSTTSPLPDPFTYHSPTNSFFMYIIRSKVVQINFSKVVTRTRRSVRTHHRRGRDHGNGACACCPAPGSGCPATSCLLFPLPGRLATAERFVLCSTLCPLHCSLPSAPSRLCPLHQSRFKRLYCARVGQSAALLNYMCGDEVGSAEVVQDRSGRLEVGSQHSGSGVAHFQSSGSGEVPIFCIGSPEVGSEGQVAMW